MDKLLEVHDLSVTYQNVTALDHVQLDLPQGHRIAVIGPNGAGKSTLMQASLGLIKSQGQVKLLGQPVDQVRQQIAYVPQRANVNWYFPVTVEEVVLMGISSKRWGFRRISKEARAQAYAALETMQLIDLKNRQINQLSGGQKQRVFLARAIAQDAQAYFLDEPLAGVDQNSEKIIIDQIKAFQAQGKSSVTVHHQLETLKEYFDYVVLVNKKIVGAGPLEQVLNQDIINLTYTGTNNLGLEG